MYVSKCGRCLNLTFDKYCKVHRCAHGSNTFRGDLHCRHKVIEGGNTVPNTTIVVTVIGMKMTPVVASVMKIFISALELSWFNNHEGCASFTTNSTCSTRVMSTNKSRR